ncbi:acyl-CoA/acyl-ACP dehydrogenase [bacterium]|nr:acyl-CoA/acyl-ACP dehydrogenase [bacterium]
MDLDYTKEQSMLRKSVEEFLAKECPFDEVREIEDSEAGYSSSMWKKMAKLGWMELYFPEAYGGLGDPFGDVAIIMEEMGKKAFISPFFSTVIQCGLILVEGGSEKQKEALLPEIAAGKRIMSLAQLEEEGSYLESGINMPALKSNGGFVLNGVKMFAMDANIANQLIVAARVAGSGVTLFLVDAGDPGITCTKLSSIGKDNLCRLVFKDVAVAEANLIGKIGEGWKILKKIEARATLAKCAEMLGGCAEAIDMTKEYAKQREQYSTPIGGFQAIQHYMADMLLAYDTSLYYYHKVCWMIDEGMDVATEISALKAQVNEKFKFITERSVQIHGGIGTTREFNIGLFYRRAKAFEYVMGDTDYHYAKLVAALDL